MLGRATVLMPCFNHEQYVAESIRSVWSQIHDDVELVVIDDGSSDGSRDVLRALRRERDFTYIENEGNLGLNASLELALAAATGEYISALASDDTIEPHKLARQVEHLRRSGDDVVYAGGWMLFPDGARERIDFKTVASAFDTGAALRLLYTDDTKGPLVQSALFRGVVYRAMTAIRTRFLSDDWALAIAVLERYRVSFIDEPVFTYRQHPGNTYRRYWSTFPMRADVISTLTPEDLRDEALANLLESQGTFLWSEGERWRALKYAAAGYVLDPDARRLRKASQSLTSWLARHRASGAT